MGLSSPYYRIYRKNLFGKNTDDQYCLDKRYADDRFVLCNAFRIIEEDLREIFEFIEPTEKNGNIYSHRLFELLMKCATEVENNCKNILVANGYRKANDLNIKDYFKVEKATNLSKYKIRLNIWSPKPRIFQPFKAWMNTYALTWYQHYNNVKHSRSTCFQEANLVNVLNAATAVMGLLFAQFHNFAFNPYHDNNSYNIDSAGFLSTDDSLMSIKPYENWSKKKSYNFDWNTVKMTSAPFQKFPF